ncbi:MAG TPA: serine/threonine-protein kinase [Isosphaeraceae bacterium]|nr:serine/threonine-protein kinase [Isosphaeraceae bacterium]
MGPSPCPEDHELLALAAGGPVPEPLRRHMDACGGCRLRVERLRAEIAAVRQVTDDLPAAARAEPTTIPPQAATAAWPSATESVTASSTTPAPAEPPPRPESIGRYRVVGELDSGGQASVYRAVHPTLPRDLAIKIAHQPSPIDRSLLTGDAAILCELDHPNLVRVYDLDVHDGRPFVAMEFVRGRHLKQVAEQSRPTVRQAVSWVAEVARALEYAHRRGVVHQDVKPQNILLDESGRPRLIDFGVARWRHAWSDGSAGPSGGTLAFMAPEQARCESERIGAASDLFALGGVLYFLLTGKAPFEGETRDEQWRRAINCDFDRSALQAKRVPRRLERIVLKAMAARPEDRYASAEQMAAALDALGRRTRRLALQAGVLVLGTLALAVWSLWPRPAPESTPATPINPSNRHPMSISAARSAVQPLRIESFQVELYSREPGDPVGLVGIEAFAARFAQDVRVNVRLSVPAFCFLIALNPDGSTQLCYPEAPELAPAATTTIDYPSDPVSGFGLTDGVGTQVFVLVASAKPLPSYAQWSRTLGELPWKPAAAALVWRYDGRNFESDTQRGAVRPLADLPPPLDAACRALQHGPGIEAIRALAFPVQPQPESKKEPSRPG